MNNISTLFDFLLERKQRGLLYHYTDLLGAHEILFSNSIGKMGYDGHVSTSFTRDKLFHTMSRTVWTIMRFTIDGDALSDRYKIEPFNDFPTGKLDVMQAHELKRRDTLAFVEAEEVVEKIIRPVRPLIVAVDIIPQKIQLRASFVDLFNKRTDAKEAIGEYFVNNHISSEAIERYRKFMADKFAITIGII